MPVLRQHTRNAIEVTPTLFSALAALIASKMLIEGRMELQYITGDVVAEYETENGVVIRLEQYLALQDEAMRTLAQIRAAALK